MSAISELFDAEKAKLSKSPENTTEKSSEATEEIKDGLKPETSVEKESEPVIKTELVAELETQEKTEKKLSKEEELDAIFSNDEDEIEDEILVKDKDDNAKEQEKAKWQKRRENIAKIEEQLARENNNPEITERLIEQGVQSLIFNKQIIKARIDGIEKVNTVILLTAL